MVKNKVAPPFRTCEFDILYGEGISYEGDLVDIGTDQGVINKSGTWYSYGDDRLGQGREAARTFLKEHRDVATVIDGKIRERVGLVTAPLASAAATRDQGERVEKDAKAPATAGKKAAEVPRAGRQ